MPFTPTYNVVPCEGGYAVETTSANGTKYLCTLATPHKAKAEQWCRALQGAARVETERAKDVREGKRQMDDA